MPAGVPRVYRVGMYRVVHLPRVYREAYSRVYTPPFLPWWVYGPPPASLSTPVSLLGVERRRPRITTFSQESEKCPETGKDTRMVNDY